MRLRLPHACIAVTHVLTCVHGSPPPTRVMPRAVQDMPRPFTKLKALDMEALAEEVVAGLQ